MPQDILHDCPLSGIELMVLVRRLKKARASEGGLGPTEDALLHRFERLLPPKLRPIEPGEDPAQALGRFPALVPEPVFGRVQSDHVGVGISQRHAHAKERFVSP